MTSRKNPIQHERKLQIEAVDAIRRMFPHVLCIHVPNGGKRHAREGANFKRMGVTAGVPDLILWWDGGHGVIELKHGKNDLQDTQRVILNQLSGFGVRNAVCRTLDEVVQALHCWGLR